MRSLLIAVLGILLLGATAGCTGERDRGINKDRDKPRTPATEKAG
jgi:hypothetical protein